MKHQYNLYKFILLFSILLFVVIPLRVSADCSIPGWPGCTEKNFYDALNQKQSQDNFQRQLQLQRENNRLLQEQNNLMRSQQFNLNQNNNIQPSQPGLFGACSGMPLTTPGCWGNR